MHARTQAPPVSRTSQIAFHLNVRPPLCRPAVRQLFMVRPFVDTSNPIQSCAVTPVSDSAARSFGTVASGAKIALFGTPGLLVASKSWHYQIHAPTSASGQLGIESREDHVDVVFAQCQSQEPWIGWCPVSPRQSVCTRAVLTRSLFIFCSPFFVPVPEENEWGSAIISQRHGPLQRTGPLLDVPSEVWPLFRGGGSECKQPVACDVQIRAHSMHVDMHAHARTRTHAPVLVNLSENIHAVFLCACVCVCARARVCGLRDASPLPEPPTDALCNGQTSSPRMPCFWSIALL